MLSFLSFYIGRAEYKGVVHAKSAAGTTEHGALGLSLICLEGLSQSNRALVARARMPHHRRCIEPGRGRGASVY